MRPHASADGSVSRKPSPKQAASPSSNSSPQRRTTASVFTRLAPSIDDGQHTSIFGSDMDARTLLAQRTAAGYERHVHAQCEESNRVVKAARARDARMRAGTRVPGPGVNTVPRTIFVGVTMAESEKEGKKKRAGLRERSRRTAARRMLSQRVARMGRHGAHEGTALGGAVGAERRLQMHGDTSARTIARKQGTFEREAVVSRGGGGGYTRGYTTVGQAGEEEEEGGEAQRRGWAVTKPSTLIIEPRARNTWMSAVDVRWPQADVEPARTCDRDRSHHPPRALFPASLPGPLLAEKRRAAYVAPPPTPPFPSVEPYRQQRSGLGRRHLSPAPPSDPTSPATLSVDEAVRVCDLISFSHSCQDGLSNSACDGNNAPGLASSLPPFSLASLRLLEVAHPSLRARHAVLRLVAPHALLRRWAAFLAVADAEDAEAYVAAVVAGERGGAMGNGEEATRRRLARRLGGMLVAFGAWTATAASTATGVVAGIGASPGTSAAASEELRVALAGLNSDAEKHGGWVKSAISEWRAYRASWYAARR